jgi:hypothetical protein
LLQLKGAAAFRSPLIALFIGASGQLMVCLVRKSLLSPYRFSEHTSRSRHFVGEPRADRRRGFYSWKSETSVIRLIALFYCLHVKRTMKDFWIVLQLPFSNAGIGPENVEMVENY